MADTTRQSNRFSWADCAKGLSIVGVCIMHVLTSIPGAEDTWLGRMSAVLDPLRMPLFFLVSGLFAHRVIQRSLSDLWYRRLWFLLVPYLVFSPFQAAIRLGTTEDFTWYNVIKALLVGDPGLWFLYALMVYNLLAWFLRKLPPHVAVALSFVPLMLGIAFGAMEHMWPRNLLQYLPIFMIGLHYRQYFFGLAKRAFQPWTIVWSISLFTAFEVAYRIFVVPNIEDWNATVASWAMLYAIFRNLGALPLGVMVGVWLSHVPIIERIFGAVGRNTLPIYASHHIMLHVAAEMVIPQMILAGWVSETYLDSLWDQVVVKLLVCVFAGVLFYWIGRIPVAGWILFPPALPGRKNIKKG